MKLLSPNFPLICCFSKILCGCVLVPKTTVKILCQKMATRRGQRVKKEVTYSVKNTLPITSNPALMSISHKLSVRDVACRAFQKGLCHHKQRLVSISSTSQFRYLNSIELMEPYGVVFIGRGRQRLVGWLWTRLGK